METKQVLENCFNINFDPYDLLHLRHTIYCMSNFLCMCMDAHKYNCMSPGKACTVNALLSVNSQNIFLKNSIENLGIRSGSYNGRTSVSIEIAEMSHQHKQFKLFFTVDEFSKLLSKKKKKKKKVK